MTIEDEQNNLSQIPQQWLWAKLEEIGANEKNAIVDGPFGSNLKVSDYIDDKTGVPVLTTKNLEYGYGNDFLRFISHEKFDRLKRSEVKGGDILVAKIGSCGKNSIYPDNMPSAMIPANLLKMTVHPIIERAYVYYYLNSLSFKRELKKIITSTAQPAFNVSKFRKLPIPLPPLPEQHRIVTKIEELFTKLDAGIEALKKVKAQLKRYRQAVLKYAFEGKLTKEWREAHKGEIEPASVLLERIKEEQKRALKGKYKGHRSLDTSDLPELPEGWAWANFDQLKEVVPNAIKAGPFGSSLKKEFYVSMGYKIYGQEQVLRSDPFYGDYYIDHELYDKLKSCSVKPGDILISLVGTIGRVLVLPEGIESGIINPRLVKLTLNKRLVASKYIKAYLDSSSVRHYFSLLSHGGTMDILNLSILRELPVPLPPLWEQKAIMNLIERYTTEADWVENVVGQSLKQAEKLRQSILKKAFEGKLVPQDPSDEPAKNLLERIKADKAKREAEERMKKRSKIRVNTEQMRLM